MELTQAERQILDALLAGTHPALAILREQLAYARVERRDHSGVGFFAHLTVPSDVARLPVRHWVLRDVGITHPALAYGGGAVLFVKHGALTTLEGFTYGSETWPDGADGLTVGYLTRGQPLGAGGYQLENSAQRDEAWLAEEYALVSG